MMTEGGGEVMTTEGGVEVQLERKARQQREKEESARTFIGPAARGGGGPLRNSVSSPESGALIGPDPLRGLAAMAGNCNSPFPAR